MRLICVSTKLKTITHNMVYTGVRANGYTLVMGDRGEIKSYSNHHFKAYDERHCERMGLCVLKDTCKLDKRQYSGVCGYHREV